MNSLFNLDNPVMRFLSKVFDVMLLSAIWGLFCLPIVTIGASTTAMYYATVKVIRRERGYVFQEFWKSFKMNFLQGTLCWILVVAATALFYANVKFATGINTKMGTILEIVYMAMGLIVLGCGVYLFPVLSRFSMKTMQLIKTCLFLFFKYIPKSILMGLIVAVACVCIYFSSIMIFFVPVCATLLFSLIMEPILKKYTPQASEDDENKRDEWYLE